MATPNNEREIVRDLARQVFELANSEKYERRRKRWRDVNGLRKPDRVPVWCRPVGCWPELLPEDALKCETPFYRNLERDFRRTLIKDEIGDDEIVDPWFSVNAVWMPQQEHMWGVEVKRIPPNQPGGAWKYDPPLKTEADFDKLTLPEFEYDGKATEQRMNQFQELLGDIMPVRLVCGTGANATLCTPAAELRGLEQLMMDMAFQPHLVHRLMAHLRDGYLRILDEREASGLLTPNNTGPMFCSDPINQDHPDHPVRAEDLWCAANSQEFDQVSPAMWRDMLLAYQMPIMERFGLSAYGCCEDLTQKIDGVLSIPNLRIFVSSAWTDLEKVAEAVGRDYTIMWRQKATDVTFAPDVTPIRRHLEQGMKKLKGCYVQIVLRELQTLNGRPERLREWATVGKEVAEKYA